MDPKENTMKITTKIFITLLLSLGIVLSACTPEASRGDITERPINVVTTTGMIADAVDNVGGERVDVTNLMGPGIDPHLYKASEGDVSRMANADIIFYNGLGLEAQMGEVFQQMRGQIVTVAVAEGIDEARLLEDEEYDGAPDPHIWFDVSLWTHAVERVRDSLIEIDPGSRVYYQANTESYLAQLDELHEYILAQAARVPESQRVLITAHDAFQYFGAAYGFEVRGLQGLSTESEAGTADIREMAEFIVERDIRAIFIETSVPDRSIQAVQAAVIARDHQVEIGGELYSDALGNPGTQAGTYLGMLEYNINTIVSALLGQ
jgi:manganese/zinc/iron transport system substrate-binding protein